MVATARSKLPWAYASIPPKDHFFSAGFAILALIVLSNTFLVIFSETWPSHKEFALFMQLATSESQ